MMDSRVLHKEEKEDSYDSFESGSGYHSCEPSNSDEDIGSSSKGAEEDSPGEIQKH